MAYVRITDIQPGDSILPATLNQTVAQWETQDTTITAVNLRVEGLLHKNIADYAATPQNAGGTWRTCEPYIFDGDITDATPPATPTAVNDGTDIVAIGPIDYDPGETPRLIVRCSTEAKLAVGDPFTLHLQLKYSTDWDGDPATVGAATWSNLGATLRSVRVNSTDAGDVAYFGVYTVAHRFDPTGAVAASSNLRFALFWHTTGAGVSPTAVLSSTTMSARNIRR